MYAKILSQILDSSLAEDYQTRHVFMDFLVLADNEGVVDMTYEAIARRTNVPIDLVKDAVGKLCKPDVNSRSQEANGCRLLSLDANRSWGWQIVNYTKYRNMRDNNARREYMRLYMQRRRESPVVRKQPVSSSKHSKPQLASDTDSDTDTDIKKEKKEYRAHVHLLEVEHEKLLKKYQEPQLVEAMLDKLDAYKASKGKTYKSDYAAVLSWVADEVLKKQPPKPLTEEDRIKAIAERHEQYEQRKAGLGYG